MKRYVITVRHYDSEELEVYGPYSSSEAKLRKLDMTSYFDEQGTILNIKITKLFPWHGKITRDD
jgi:hypothetical protein